MVCACGCIETYIAREPSHKMGTATVAKAGGTHVEFGQRLVMEQSIAQRLGAEKP